MLTQGNLLLVDDNEDSLDALSRHLQRRGFDVATATSGRKALDMVGENVFDLVLLDVMMPGLDGGDVLSFLREKHTESELPVIMVTARSQGEDIVRFLGMGANDYVTKPVDVDVLLARIGTQMRLRRLMQLKDDFLAMASHDLKSPLAAVLTSSEVLQMMVPPGATMTDDGGRLVAGIHERATTMRRLVEDFLDFQVLRDGRMVLEPRPLDLVSTLARVVETNQRVAVQRDLRIRQENPSTPVEAVSADSSRITQVMENLVGNALKFSPPGTEVVVSVCPCEQGVEVAVRDSGPGVPYHEMQRVFERYVRLPGQSSRRGSGSGLGLAIATRIVELHRGQIGVRNNPEGGATFWFRLPGAGGTPP